uniref:Kinase n=1 Tax=Ixodes ricinus TaxID=34613 RepID=A0A090X988_IXORI
MSDEAPLPEDTLLFDHQIAGHVHGSTKTRLGLLKHKDGSILKPLVRSDERTLREQKFYETQSSSPTTALLNSSTLRAFVPKYKGVWKTNINREEVEYLKLDDLARVFRKPSIIDVKIGAKTYDPLASKEKVALETSKYPWSQQIGLPHFGHASFRHHRAQVQSLSERTMACDRLQTQCLKRSGRSSGHRKSGRLPFLPELLLQLEDIRSWFEKQRLYAFYSSSLLLMYDAPNE